MLLVSRRGLGEIRDGFICGAEVELDLFAAISQRRRFLQRLGGVLVLGLLVQDRPQAVERFGPGRIELGDLAVGRRGLGVVSLPGVDVGQQEVALDVGRIDLDRLFQVDPGRHLLVEPYGRPAGEVVPLDRLEEALLGLGFELGHLTGPGNGDEGVDREAEPEVPVPDEEHPDQLAVDVDERTAAELLRARDRDLEDLARGAEIDRPA